MVVASMRKIGRRVGLCLALAYLKIGCAEQSEAHRLYNDAPPSVGTSYAL